jgi:hypothetical protein
MKAKMPTRDIALPEYTQRLDDGIATACRLRDANVYDSEVRECRDSSSSFFSLWCIDRSVSYVSIVVTAAGTARTMLVPMPL